MRIIIVGAGEVGHNLCATLSEDGHNVTLIERSQQRCEKLDEEQNARIIAGNGSSARLLVEADVTRCDAFLAMTSDDHTNVISCSIAKALGAKKTIARIHDETYSDSSVVNYQLHFGIDLLVNPEAICAAEVICNSPNWLNDRQGPIRATIAGASISRLRIGASWLELPVILTFSSEPQLRGKRGDRAWNLRLC